MVLLEGEAMPTGDHGDALLAQQLVQGGFQVEAQRAGRLVQKGNPWAMVEHTAD